jgi:tetratricopeptide (TPR) repeat protein
VDVTPQETLRTAEQAIAVFQNLGDDLGLARAWRLVGQAHYLDRRGGASAAANEEALVYARRARDHFEEREIVEWLLVALLLGPAPAAEAIARCERLLDETAHMEQLRAQVLAALAPLVAMQGRRSEAAELIRESRAVMQQFGEWIWIVTFWWGFVHLWNGDPRSAERELRPAYDELKKIGEKSHFSSICHALASVTLAQGRFDETERLTQECEEAARENDVHSQILWRSIRAKTVAHRGDLALAEQLARDAVEIAAASDFLFAHGDALVDLADVLVLGARRDEAVQMLQASLVLYEAKGNLLAVDQARARLRQLA